MKVAATPPATSRPRKYQIDVDVTGANGATGKIQLTAEVTGMGKLDLATTDERLNLSGHANRTSRETLVVTNTGTAALTASASAPRRRADGR